MTQSEYDKLVELLNELLQLDRPELDFGIYRVINQRRDDINDFLARRLLPTARESLRRFDEAARESAERELIQVESELANLGVERETSPKWKELNARVQEFRSADAVEASVYSRLYDFFRRYYKQGDFLALRRYREGVYAVPYEGEEVLLYWANHDQYYVKSAEDFQAYTFVVGGDKRVEFRLDSAEVEEDNNKGKSPRFVLSKTKPRVEGDRLVVLFDYRPLDLAQPQSKLNEKIVEQVLAAVPAKWKAELGKLSDSGRSLLDLNVHRYTAKNSFDYFVHKDLRRFLVRELEFYLKNELLRLDEVLSGDGQLQDLALRQATAVNVVAKEIIDFVAQLEDFQRDLYTKKKLVLETNYCFTLQDLPADLQRDVCRVDAVRDEWSTLYRVSVDESDLAANQHLVVDTARLPRDLRLRVLKAIPDIDDRCDGLLVHGDNRQALDLLAKTFSGTAQLVYVDPPFNTEGDTFLYKDAYRTSSWLAMMKDRLAQGRRLLVKDGTFYLHLDANANYLGRHLMNDLFGSDNYLNEVIWRIGWVSGYKTKADRYVRNHDTLLVYGNSPKPYFDKDAARIPYRDVARSRVESSIKALMDEFELDENDVRNYKIVFKDKANVVYKVAEDDKESRYNVEDTWNSSDYEDLNSNKIKRNVAEYTPNGSVLTQKPEELLRRVIEVSSKPGDLVVDYFAGSGTTPAAAAKLGRRYVAVEMGEHFDTDLLWRMKQVLFGKQVGISSAVGHVPGGRFKYVRLEGYEDALENVELKRSDVQLELLADADASREYMLRYMLNEEAGVLGLARPEAFCKPFDVETVVLRQGQRTVVPVDLPETYNFLMGLSVKRRWYGDGWLVASAEREKSSQLVVWRDTERVDEDALRALLNESEIRAALSASTVLHVNGDCAVEQIRTDEESWTVVLIDVAFAGAMLGVA